MTNSTKPRSKHATWAWMLWDWAEQPYPTIFQTFIFTTYITGLAFTASGVLEGTAAFDPLVASTERAVLATQLGWAGLVAGLIVAFSAPVFGRRADTSGRRKFWLLINTGLLVLVMLASFFVEPKPEFFIFALVLFAIGSVVQETAFVNYFAMLKQVTTESSMARVSGMAWALGYVGGIILLLVSLVLCYLPGHPVFPGEEDALNIRVIFLFAAAWMVVFTIPLILFVPELEKSKSPIARERVLDSYRALFKQIVGLRKTNPDALKFLIASAIYRDGLAGIFTYGAILGTVAFGFDATGVILYGVGANIVAGIGAFLGGLLDTRIGTRRVIVISLIGLIVAGACVFVFAGLGPITFWVFGLALTLFVGPAQASSRTFVARFAPVNREGEVFGLYQTTGRAASVLSPTLWVFALTVATAAGASNPALFGILGILVLLVVGLILLLRVHPQPQVMD